MTTLLPPIVSSPFGKRFDHKPYDLNDGLARALPTTNTSSTSLNTVLVKRSRQISPASVSSFRSAPLSLNKENTSPPPDHQGHRGLPRTLGKHHTVRKASAPATLAGHGEITPSAFRQSASSCQGKDSKPGGESKRDLEQNANADVLRRALAEVQKSSYGRDRLSDATQNGKRQIELPGHCQSETKHTTDTERSADWVHFSQPRVLPEPATEVAETPDKRRQQVAKARAQTLEHPSSPISPPHLKYHRSRLSDASSAFVHTIKTASLSNASFGGIPRSLRLGHSSDAQGCAGSHPRFSVDSDRPATTSSLDDAAIRRGVKRHQIIQEIIHSEESYLADVRALVYLYMTLLASASSLSNQMRSSIQDNVMEILHLHEHLVEQLHLMALKTANRRWADTASPRRLSFNGHLRWRSLEPSFVPTSVGRHRPTRSSLESTEIPRASVRLQTAEPADVTDVAHIFKKFMSRFFVYEEYSAKYEIMVSELNHYVPRWSSFETGIEALNKSLSALNAREQDEKKAMAVKDLLVKPIQRVCKYPLLLDDLLQNTHVADCPNAHTEIETTLQCFRDIVQEVNRAADSQLARRQIQQRWLLHDRLNFQDGLLQACQFRGLGQTQLCGVLHAAWNSKTRVDGCYALSILFDTYFVLAIPAGSTSKFNIVAVIHQSDLKVDSASDGKGLQCHTALFTWKLSFEADGQLYEIIFSACSAIEEDQWVRYLQRKAGPPCSSDCRSVPTAVSSDLNLKPAGIVFGQATTLTRRLSIQRAATVGNRASICQVIVRNTHNPQDLQDFRQPSPVAINRSQSHSTSHRVVVLAPKRSERARLESSLSNVWTRDTLPYPGMVASRGGQIIRASAGSLVRKLSLASLHGPFTRRSSSLTLAHRKSYEAFLEARKEIEAAPPPPPVFEIQKKDSHDETAEMAEAKSCGAQPPSTSAGGRKFSSSSKRLSLSGPDGLLRRGTQKGRRLSKAEVPVGPEDSAKEFYVCAEKGIVEDKLGNKKRWSNPIGLLKNLSAEGIRHMLYSSK